MDHSQRILVSLVMLRKRKIIFGITPETKKSFVRNGSNKSAKEVAKFFFVNIMQSLASWSRGERTGDRVDEFSG